MRVTAEIRGPEADAVAHAHRPDIPRFGPQDPFAEGEAAEAGLLTRPSAETEATGDHAGAIRQAQFWRQHDDVRQRAPGLRRYHGCHCAQ